MSLILSFFFLATLTFAQDPAGSSVLSELATVRNKSQDGQAKMLIVGTQFTQQAAFKYSHGNDCQKSCPLGCCGSGNNLVVEGAAFLVLNDQATLQAEIHQLAAFEACRVYNQLASAPSDCSALKSPVLATTPQSSWYDSKGQCKATAPPECVIIGAVPGSEIFGKPDFNCQKFGKCEADFYTTYTKNSDGSYSVKLGGTAGSPEKVIKLTAESFKNKNVLIAAGVSPDYAAGLSQRFDRNRQYLAAVSGRAIGSKAAVSASTGGDVAVSEKVEASQQKIYSAAAGNRSKVKVVGDYLTIDFNGEPIHIEGTDIFKIISLRYNKQEDSFIPVGK